MSQPMPKTEYCQPADRPKTEYCVVDTGPLINFVMGGQMDALTRATDHFQFKIIDVVVMEATLPGKPGSAEISAWLKEQQARGCLDIINTPTGDEMREGRKKDPYFRIRHGGEHAICDWLATGAANNADHVVVVYEDKGMLKNLQKAFFDANISAATTRAFLEIGERVGFVDSAAESWDAMATASPTRCKLNMVTPVSTKAAPAEIQMAQPSAPQTAVPVTYPRLVPL